MIVLVCGSREWFRADLIREKLAQLPRGTTIIHGAARGADTIAAAIAGQLGFDVIAFPVDWRRGRGAAFERNIEMLERRPDLVIAFQRDGSTGTQHVIDNALRRGIPVDVIAQ